MSRSFPVMFVLTILLLSSIALVQNGSGNEPVGTMTVQDMPTRELSTNVTGSLYDGLITYEDVALIVNDNSSISRDIGTYFFQKRGLPEINIINISVPDKEIITFSEYDELARQVRENLSDRELTSKINYMVTTKGVPLKVTSGQYNMNYQSYYESASVDSELMLLDSHLEGQVHRRWTVENPYAGSGEPFSREEFGIRLVTRLTGYTKEEAMALVDRGDDSLGNRGNAFLDMDPTKNGSGGYRQGNTWMADAHTWLRDNGYPSILEDTRDFETNRNDLMAYYSWGSNDNDWSEGQLYNGGFETGTDAQASGWTYDDIGGTIERTSESYYGGSWSLKLQRNGTGVLRAYRDTDLTYLDHRYLPDARMSISGVTSPGARVILEGYDAGSNLIWSHELANRTGTRGFNNYQDPIENDTRVTGIRFVVELLGEGTAYFDNLNLRVIRPHNTWVNGSVAETIVSTGGRSMTYGTGYGQSLVADIIRDGVTGIKGYTWEPFITAVSRAHILFPAYYLGFSLAESFWMGSPYLSWMGTVIGDPKVTPFLNERADMGPVLDSDPLYTWIDDDGISWLTFVLYNKGGREVEEGIVKLYMEGKTQFHEESVTLAPGGVHYINISSDIKEIKGSHQFTVEMDPDNEVWEYDEHNNILVKNLTVNTRPEMTVSVSSGEVARTDTLEFFLNISDPDMDLSTGGIDLIVKGPGENEMSPVLMEGHIEGDLMVATYSFTPEWNTTLGFHSLEAVYTDPGGSSARKQLFGVFKVINHAPSLSGNITSSEVPRGGAVTVDIGWFDPDTPDGSLTLTGFAEDPSGVKITPFNVTANGTHGAQMMYRLPPEYPAQTWVFHATVEDDDGGFAEWDSLLRTYNREPSIEILNGTGSRITRLETVKFEIRYMDPEGQASDEINIRVYGPEGDPGLMSIYDEDHILNSGEVLELNIPGFGLLLGNYTLEIVYSDDQALGGTLTIPSAFEVCNLAPTFEDISLKYPQGDAPPGGTFMRGRSVTITVTAFDLDGGTDPLDVSGHLYHNSTMEKIGISFESRGTTAYISRVSPDGDWEVGEYTLVLDVMDRDGASIEKVIPTIFKLDAEPPTFQFGEMFIDLNLSADVEIYFAMNFGSSIPEIVILHLFDVNGSEIGTIAMAGQGDPGVWKAVKSIDAVPDFIDVEMVDDIGKTSWTYGSVTIEVAKEPAGFEEEDTGETDDNSLLYIILILLVLILLLVLALVLVVALRPREADSGMVPAPPMGSPLPPSAGAYGLPAARPPSLPPSSETAPLPPVHAPGPLPPGRELINGSSYHRPANEEPANGGVEGDVMPPAPPVPGPDGSHSKGTNTGSGVEPPSKDVQDTDSADAPGDTGQGEQEVQQGPGSGPGLQVPNAEAEQVQG